MTDKEIIQALECCIDYPSCPTDCPLYEQPMDCLLKLSKPTLNLIKRQKAEIESLRESFNFDFDNFASEYDSKIKAEAIKEFAERLKAKVQKPEYPREDFFVCESDIEELLEEMGVNNAD